MTDAREEWWRCWGRKGRCEARGARVRPCAVTVLLMRGEGETTDGAFRHLPLEEWPQRGVQGRGMSGGSGQVAAQRWQNTRFWRSNIRTDISVTAGLKRGEDFSHVAGTLLQFTVYWEDKACSQSAGGYNEAKAEELQRNWDDIKSENTFQCFYLVSLGTPDLFLFYLWPTCKKKTTSSVPRTLYIYKIFYYFYCLICNVMAKPDQATVIWHECGKSIQSGAWIIHIWYCLDFSPHVFNQYIIQHKTARDQSGGRAKDVKWLGKVWASAVCLEIN